MVKRYVNGSYKLQEVNGKVHETRVNGWRLKPYFLRFEAGATTAVALIKKTRETPFPPSKIGSNGFYARGMNTSSI